MATKKYICYYYYKEEGLTDVPAAYILQLMGYKVYFSRSDNNIYIDYKDDIPNISENLHSLIAILKYPNGYPFEKMHMYKSKVINQCESKLYSAPDVSNYMKNRERNIIRASKEKA